MGTTSTRAEDISLQELLKKKKKTDQLPNVFECLERKFTLLAKILEMHRKRHLKKTGQ